MIRFISHTRLAARVATRPPEYLAELQPCIVNRDAAGIWIDTKHEAWQKMRRKYRPRCSERPGPGALVKRTLDALGYREKKGCGCEQFCRRMNQWGWKGCWGHRREIIGWFSARAAEQGIEASTIAGLVLKGLLAAPRLTGANNTTSKQE